METANRVYINRKFNCSVSALFNWLVQPELMVQWFGPEHLTVGTVVSDFRVGGLYSIELKKSGTRNFLIEGEYIEIKAPEILTFSFQYTGLLPAPPKSIVKITLAKIADNVSSLSLTQEFDFTPSDMDKRTKAWEHMFRILNEKVSVPTH